MTQAIGTIPTGSIGGAVARFAVNAGLNIVLIN
jgi:hypothetical protein